ncbi:uncharacterized protein [Palaemon carinicauda]|uniref:uncharacterized protein n=1 Tax=Palaemon carinicauda TaxID=392227 RepID=UPI0035B5CDFF
MVETNRTLIVQMLDKDMIDLIEKLTTTIIHIQKEIGMGVTNVVNLITTNPTDIGQEGSAIENAKCNDFLKIVHTNAQSILGHILEIQLMLEEQKIDILCISETWLYPYISDTFIHIPEYNIYREDHGRGGGVCLYIRNYLKVTELKFGIEKQEGVEDKWVSVQHRKFPSIIVGCVYRHPKAAVTSFNYISDVFKEVILRNKPIFIYGDFNDDLLKKENKLGKLIKNLRFDQIVDKPTRITSTSASLIDLVITNSKYMIRKSEVTPSSIADHENILTLLNVRKPKRQTIFKTFRCLKNYFQETLCSLLMNNVHILNQILSTDNVSKQVEVLTNVFTSCVDMCAPVVTREVTRPPAPWISDTIKETIMVRDNVKKKLKNQRENTQLRETHKELKKKVNSMLTDSRRQYYKQEFKNAKGDMAATWKITNNMLFNRINSDTNKLNCDTKDDLQRKAEEFNEFFAEVGRKTFEKTQEELHNRMPLETDPIIPHSRVDSFKPRPVDCNTVILVIKDLKETNAFGSDVWGCTNKSQLQRVQKLQNFAARVAVGNVRKFEHVTPHLKELEWLKIRDQYTLDMCTMLFA